MLYTLIIFVHTEIKRIKIKLCIFMWLLLLGDGTMVTLAILPTFQRSLQSPSSEQNDYPWIF